MRASRQRGFTLIEIMMVVALIAVLAAIAIPNFFSQTSRAKSDAEVLEIFAELRIRQEQYKFENGAYLATTADESSLYPASPSKDERDLLGSLPAAWQNLRYRGRSSAHCSYGVVAGGSGDTATGTKAGEFNYTAPATAWYYILAWCDMDGSSSVDGYYFTDSVDSSIRKQNAGR